MGRRAEGTYGCRRTHMRILRFWMSKGVGSLFLQTSCSGGNVGRKKTPDPFNTALGRRTDVACQHATRAALGSPAGLKGVRHGNC